MIAIENTPSFKNERVFYSGDPIGNRTRIYAVKGRRPKPLDDRAG